MIAYNGIYEAHANRLDGLDWIS